MYFEPIVVDLAPKPMEEEAADPMDVEDDLSSRTRRWRLSQRRTGALRMTRRRWVQTPTGYLRLDPSLELRGLTLFGFSPPSFLLVTPSATNPFLTTGGFKIMYFLCVLWLCMLFVYSIYKWIS